MFKLLKILFWVGVGFVLGAKAGRERYEQIRAGAQKVAGNPTVQRTVTRAEDTVRHQAPFLKEKTGSAGFPRDPQQPGV